MTNIFELALKNAEVKIKAENDLKEQIAKSKLEVMIEFSKPVLELITFLHSNPLNVLKDGRKMFSTNSDGSLYINNFKGLSPYFNLINLRKLYAIRCQVDDDFNCKIIVTVPRRFSPNVDIEFTEFEPFMIYVIKAVVSERNTSGWNS